MPTQEGFLSDVKKFIELLQGRIGELEAELATKEPLLSVKQANFTKIDKAPIKKISNEYYNQLARNIYGKKQITKHKNLVEYETLSSVIENLKSNIDTLTEHIRMLHNLLDACTNFVSDPSIRTAEPLYDFYINGDFNTNSTTFNDSRGTIYDALGYGVRYGSHSGQGEKGFDPNPEEPLHTLYETLKKEYKHLYGKIIADERREAQRVAKIAANERQAEYERQQEQDDKLQKIINPIWTWIFEVEERMERPGNTSYNPFSKKVELPPDIKEHISGQIDAIKFIINDIQAVTPKTDETKRQLITGIRTIYTHITNDKHLMKTLKDSYPRLYRAFFINEGRLTKINGKTNLFKYGRSSDFIASLGVTSGGKRTKKQRKQTKHKRRRTVRR